MKNVQLNQKGFGHVVVVFLLLFVAITVFAGYKIVSMNKDGADTVASSSSVNSGVVPNKISTKSDLVQTSHALDDSTAQVDTGLNDGSLDADLSDML